MASESQPRDEAEEVAEEEELVKLHEEVDEMAEKILHYRTTLPSQFTSTISSLLHSQTPLSPTHLLETQHQPDTLGLMRETTDDQDETEKIQLLKQKMSSNAAAMAGVMSRMKEYMAKLNSSNPIIHPAFKSKRTA